MLCPVKPRPRNAEATRAAILAAAVDRFSRHSYDDVGMRDIARDVGVDAALVSRYFGSKEELFEQVLESCDTGGDLMTGDRADFGHRVAREVVFGTKGETKLKGLLILLRSISSTRAMEVVRRSANARFFGPFSELVGGAEAAVSTRLAAGFIMGMAVSREITGGYDLSPAECERLAERLGRALQAVIDEGAA